VPDSPLEDRIDAAFTPNDRDSTHLAAIDIREAFDYQLRRLIDGTTD